MDDHDLLQPGWRETIHDVNGVHLHAVEAGKPGAPLILLLHGFPEFWWAWRKHITALADAGFHVVAPDTRGYNLSSAPQDLSAYRLEALAADVIGLADACGAERFQLVGHDWGALVAWWSAAHHPDRVQRLVVLDGPHPDVFSAEALKHPTLALRSTYVALFQLPLLPELALRAFGFAALESSMRRSARPEAFEPGALERYATAWSRPQRLTAMLNYYRALRYRRGGPAPRIAPPTLILWGEEDQFLGRPVMEAGLALCDNGRFVAVRDATHWLHLEQPNRITSEILGFLHDTAL